MSEWIPLFVGCSTCVSIIAAYSWGNSAQRSYDADQAISENPSHEWQEALIDAEARKQKKGLKP